MKDSTVKENRSEKIDDHSSSESQNATTDTAMEYPTRFKLFMTVVALVLSMFLVSEHYIHHFLVLRYDFDS